MLLLISVATADDGTSTDLGGASTAPALLAVGREADSVDAPATPADVAVSLGSAFDGASVGLPSSLAIEVAPGWLTPNSVTVGQYLAGGGWTAWRNIRVSASAEKDGDAWTGALGARTTIWGKAPKGTEARRFVEDYEALQKGGLASWTGAAEGLKSGCAKSIVALGAASETAYAAIKEKLAKEWAPKREVPQQQIVDVCLNPATAGFGEAAGWCREQGLEPKDGTSTAALPAQKDDDILAWLQARQKEVDKTVEDERKAYDTALQAAFAEGSKTNGEVYDGCKTVLADPRDGLVVEVGGGYGVTTTDGSFSNMEPAGWVGYAVGSYFFGRPAVSVLGRVSNLPDTFTIEGGLGFVYTLRKYDVGASAIVAYELGAQATTADVLARFDYQLSPEIWMVSGLGATLPFADLEAAGLLSQLSIRMQFGANRPTQEDLLGYDDVRAAD